MNTTKFSLNAKRALVPTGKAIKDAILFTVALVWILAVAFTGVIFNFPWLILIIYTLAQLFALLFRLRQAERQMKLAAENEQSLRETSQELHSSMQRLNRMVLRWGNLPRYF